MPELPEVETVVRYLRPKITGRKILDMSSDTPRLFRVRRSRTSTEMKSDFKKIRKQVIGRKIESLDRIGKNILFNLSGGKCLALHLMMTGKILLNPKERSAHDRLVIKLSGGVQLVFNDPRKFGRCRILEGGKVFPGQDALSLRFRGLKSLLGTRKSAIKNFLLDQRAVSGIGNIYSDEILWEAGVRPLRKTNSLREKDIKNLYRAMKRVLALAIKNGGTSMRDYRKPDGKEGGYYQLRKAHHRAGEKCSRDGATIRRIKIGARSAHYCPKHQV
ncbi:MAG: DNA-formamidopyrimidine glycosylase [Candidatus Sungbacteria bacterium]|nr:DNA-formamidopyrimidine glycosylase [Candidatus Sungbacteria bacterium]